MNQPQNLTPSSVQQVWPQCSVFEDMLRSLEHVESVYRLNVVKDSGEPSSTLNNLQRVIARAKAVPALPAVGHGLTDAAVAGILHSYFADVPREKSEGIAHDLRLLAPPAAAYADGMRAIAQRNLAAFLCKASFATNVDRQAAMNCVEVLSAPVAIPAEASAAAAVLAECARHVNEEGWTQEHDDEHPAGEMSAAAGCYLLFADSHPNRGEPPAQWPWAPEWWKPKDFRSDHVRAISLAVKEIEKAERAARRDQRESA